MNNAQLRAAFVRAYGAPGGNFMTPNVLRLGKRGRFVYELSCGRGFRDDVIYGVTVVELPGVKRSDLSRCFSGATAKADAEAYIADDFGAHQTEET